VNQYPADVQKLIDETNASHDYRRDLSCWFGLSYSTFAVMPRVLMESMPDEWQAKMAELLHDFTDTWRGWPEGSGCRVQYTLHGKLARTPEWMLNYRHPDYEQIDRLRLYPQHRTGPEES
jgi:hypothetical protein